MSKLSLQDVAEKMREIDIALMQTKTEGGTIANRPMSNNNQVDYDGDSYYFALQDTRLVRDLEHDPSVSLGFAGSKAFYVAVTGTGTLIKDKREFEAHWNPDLDKWFKNGIDTPGMVIVKVAASRIDYWYGEERGTIEL
jgi:general stress protein 26